MYRSIYTREYPGTKPGYIVHTRVCTRVDTPQTHPRSNAVAGVPRERKRFAQKHTRYKIKPSYYVIVQEKKLPTWYKVLWYRTKKKNSYYVIVSYKSSNFKLKT